MKSFQQEAAEGHRRNLLLVKHLPEFKSWLAQQGWIDHQPRGVYEVLRMKRGAEWLIVHQRGRTLSGSTHIVHCTVQGVSAIWAVKFYKLRRETGHAQQPI